MQNDRFKFRVWDDVEKCYGHNLAIMPKRGGVEQLMSTAFPGYEDRFIIEQCTGIRDKNGQLIYEGDILGDEQPLCITVVWENIYWGYYADGSFHALPYWVNQLEIIGNIHDEDMEK